jgi:hypothetical protein
LQHRTLPVKYIKLSYKTSKTNKYHFGAVPGLYRVTQISLHTRMFVTLPAVPSYFCDTLYITAPVGYNENTTAFNIHVSTEGFICRNYR